MMAKPTASDGSLRRMKHPLVSQGSYEGSPIYRYGECKVLLSGELERSETGLWHMPVSCQNRYPTWDEMGELRDALLPADREFVMIFPKASEYVNVHNFCFHLWEAQ